MNKDVNKRIAERIAQENNNKKASDNYKELAAIADRVEEIRIELFNNPVIHDEEGRDGLNNLLFKLQSQLRYDTKELLECMVIWEY